MSAWDSDIFLVLKRKAFDPKKHPRAPQGAPNSTGGEFVPVGTASGATFAGDDPTSQMYVGITSSRPHRKNPKDVSGDRKDFAEAFRQAGIRAFQSADGIGAWGDSNAEGGIEHEPTWLVRYHGNGDAIGRIARMGRAWNQDAIIVAKRTSENDPNASRRFVFKFDKLNPDTIRDVNKFAAQAGLGGWTWDSSRKQFISMGIPMWQPNDDHANAVYKLQNSIKAAGINPRLSWSWVNTLVMEREGENAYEKFYNGAPEPVRDVVKSLGNKNIKAWLASLPQDDSLAEGDTEVCGYPNKSPRGKK